MIKTKIIVSVFLVIGLVAVVNGCSGKMKEKAEQRHRETHAWVEYDANGAASGKVPVERKYITSGEAVYIKDNTGNLEKPGYIFVGWNTAADGSGRVHAPGTYFLMDKKENVTLYAQWE